MPELPEVEHIAGWLRPKLTGRQMASVVVMPSGERCLPQGRAMLESRLTGKRILGVSRRSKVIVLEFAGDFLAIHLKMTGQLWLDAKLERPYTRVALQLKDTSYLAFVDVRKFGWMQLWSPAEFSAWEAKQGPEPVPRLPVGWEAGLHGRRSIKAVLLDQAVVAGIGNIYADEILYRARLAPTRTAASLSADERARLRDVVEKEMQAAVDERGGEPDQKRVGGGDRSVKALFDWKVFQRENEPCRSCGRPIDRSVVAGRGTYSCGKCQQ